MQVTDYISALLYRYECVVIPGFGAFLTQRQPAQINAENAVCYPPKKTISFNRQLRENDGLLANYIAKNEGISYEQSLRLIRTFVDNLHETLTAHFHVDLDKIGVLSKKGEQILFQPDYTTNYLLEAFGTDSFEAKPIATSIIQKKENRVHPLPAAISVESQSIGTSFWRYAAVGVIAIGLGGFLTANWYSQQVQSHNLAAQEQAERTLETKIQQASFSIEDPLPEITFKVAEKRGKYHLVAGAFRSEENALNRLQELKGKGFHPKYIGENKYGLHQVIYDSFEERQEALKALNQIRQNNNAAAWLLVKEL